MISHTGFPNGFILNDPLISQMMMKHDKMKGSWLMMELVSCPMVVLIYVC